ncbi:hypothetical protein E3P92_02882 [Wallemia ichthyophaga]|uniref:RNA-binding protein rsd1 n=1 Tax=Wallemia ichthyophaga (strain EXF-994 / CBS 113033) TaxID=1299270 RepID=R9AFT3_WALI9|nr:RNA-binding protein rsd1 [Wallemia ichthyophaga EXF-994]EOR01063.1 RNA-binding protein rsd1 [Wallemia ichthyophaga EXF-994]TIB11460.1 hypothetical protein E3P92_02882 [Wallemia ichthyophaga]TIB30682.1 hypothetical protein E3P84_03229 [Wallemia ichthyophaga]TIB39999.1 hypothetical protein E3P83_03172 [Wallemia ichthyophaga]
MSAGDRYSPRLSPDDVDVHTHEIGSDVRDGRDVRDMRDIRSRDRSRERHERRRSRYEGYERRDSAHTHSHRRRRSRSRSRSRSHSPHSPRPRARPPRQTRPRSPEIPLSENVDSLESEQRSVFVNQLSTRTTSHDLRRFFQEKLGSRGVVDARVVSDKNSRRSKGIGYVEVRTASMIDSALELSGELLNGIPMIVTQSEADKNRMARGGGGGTNANASLAGDEGRRARAPPSHNSKPSSHAHANDSSLSPANDPALYKVFVGSLSYALREEDVHGVFAPFGAIEEVELGKDGEGQSKGYAYVKYRRMEDSRMACEQMNRFELAGRSLKVLLVNHYGTPVRMPEQSIENEGLNLNSISRHELMKTLMRSHDPAASAQEEEVRARQEEIVRQREKERSMMKTDCVLLKYMFKSSEETEAGWEKELAEDVGEECESKYGKVSKIGVDRNSEEGEIVLQFATLEGAQKAINGLNGRWFGGRQVKAVPIADRFMVRRVLIK